MDGGPRFFAVPEVDDTKPVGGVILFLGAALLIEFKQAGEDFVFG